MYNLKILVVQTNYRTLHSGNLKSFMLGNFFCVLCWWFNRCINTALNLKKLCVLDVSRVTLKRKEEIRKNGIILKLFLWYFPFFECFLFRENASQRFSCCALPFSLVSFLWFWERHFKWFCACIDIPLFRACPCQVLLQHQPVLRTHELQLLL